MDATARLTAAELALVSGSLTSGRDAALGDGLGHHTPNDITGRPSVHPG
jgi:hypothetical protein